MKFGSGSLQYELVEGWEQLPKGWQHRDVVGVSTDSQDRVYLFCRGDHPVIVYDRDGTFLESWGEGRFTYVTHGIFISPADEVFLVDCEGHSVGQYTLDGQKLQAIGPEGIPCDSGYDNDDINSIRRGSPPYNQPTNVAAGPSRELYVSDGYGNSRVHRFSQNGQLISSWGEPGIGAGEFHTPHSVWVHTDGRVFVADRENDRIQIFSPTGQHLTDWLDVRRPTYIFIDSDELVYVSELSWHVGENSFRRGPIQEEECSRVSIYDISGNLLLRWGDLDPMRAGTFNAAHGLWVDHQGSIYVAEVANSAAVSQGYAPPDCHTFQKFARR
jgi:DNA-binding beta-propeller fold protein YncE